MNVLVDTSVWIDYLRGGSASASLDGLIDDNRIVTNELVLSELVPTLTVQGEDKLIVLLRLLPVQSLAIDWHDIQSIQVKCMKKGINGIGISDLIIAQNALQYDSPLYTLDKHFHWIKSVIALKIV